MYRDEDIKKHKTIVKPQITDIVINEFNMPGSCTIQRIYIIEYLSIYLPVASLILYFLKHIKVVTQEKPWLAFEASIFLILQWENI